MTGQASKLAAALVEFQAEMPTVHKGKRANVGTYGYTYADLADVTAAAVPILTKHGLSFTTRPRCVDQGVYELVGMLRHVSGEFDEGSLPIHGRTAQEIGSSLTYGRRYLFGCLTGIVTDDDSDARPASGERTRRAAKPKPAGDAGIETGEAITPNQMKAMHASFNDAGITDRDERLAYTAGVLGRPVESSKDLTRVEAGQVIDELRKKGQHPPEDDLGIGVS